MGTPSGWRRGGNLPAEPAKFVGRRRQLQRLNELLAASRLVTLVGPGGVGKTRMAVRAASMRRDLFPDGIWLVDLSKVRNPLLLPHAVTAALGLRDRSTRTETEFLADYLADKRLLLVLDTCEHLVEPCAALVRELFACEGLHVIATSRQPLGLDFEQRVPLPPMDMDDAVELFLDRAADASLDRKVVAEICAHLDCVPLGIELAVGRLADYSPEQLLSLFGDRFRLLRRDKPGEPGEPSRHQALHATMEWSHELCSLEERLLWARLTVFAGSFDLAAVKHICAGDDLPESEILDTLFGLVDKSIVQRVPGRDRYEMLDTIRAYGEERLEELGDGSWLRSRYRDHYLGLAKRAERSWAAGSRQVYWYEQMMNEHSHLRAGMEHCLAEPAEIERGLDLAASLWFLWHGCGMTGEGAHHLDRALAASRRPSAERCRALWVRAFVASAQGDIVMAERSALRCQEEAALIGDADAMIYATKMIGLCAYLRGDLPRAVAHLGSAVKSFRAEGGLNPGLLPAIVELAACLSAQGQPEEAEPLLLECLGMCEENGEVWLRSYAQWGLAETNRQLGRTTRAITAARAALEIKREFHDVIGTLLCGELLAWLHTDGPPDPQSAERAALLLGATSASWQRFGLRRLFGSEVFIRQSDLAAERARQVLGDDAYTEIAAKGAAFDLDEVVERALA